MGFPLPDIKKFMPLWVCFGLVGGELVSFLSLLIVLATTARRADDRDGA
jgi:hypothetical protein